MGQLDGKGSRKFRRRRASLISQRENAGQYPGSIRERNKIRPPWEKSENKLPIEEQSPQNGREAE